MNLPDFDVGADTFDDDDILWVIHDGTRKDINIDDFLDEVTDDATLENYVPSDQRPRIRVKDDGITQAKIADAAVGVAQLKLGSGEIATSGNTELNVNRYSFAPRTYRTDSNSSSFACRLDNIRSHPNGSV